MTLGDTLYIANHEAIAGPETYNALALVEEHKAWLSRRKNHRLFNKFEALFGGIGFFSIFSMNLYLKRPVYAGIPWYLIGTGAGLGVGLLFSSANRRYRLQEWAVVEDYVKMHPEYFPGHPSKKIGDVLQPWAPFRNG